MLLHIRKNEENQIAMSGKITDPEQFMYSAYKQAVDALEVILKKARQAMGEDASCSGSLYHYTNNIIAFCGHRGQGKTSTMLSFTNALSKGALKENEIVGRCTFSVLPAIDPTVLENQQSILALILSRMYQFAENYWKEVNWCADFSLKSRPTEADKNELLNLFQKCLSGINAIKFCKNEKIQSLYELHEISDSALLKKDFFNLTNKVLKFSKQSERTDQHFLVIQLDDTDIQVEKGYEILEDIRKYLSIPNVVFVMATDIELLRKVVVQHFFKEFKIKIDLDEAHDTEELHLIASKYLDKLIPPTHEVYLPYLDGVVQNKYEELKLKYTESGDCGDKKETDLLKPNGYTGEKSEEDFSFQALVLRYIYKKTGIIFVEPESGSHYFIPSSLRGLCQLLGLLSSMEDLPIVADADMNQPEALARRVEEQVEILENNLTLFESYFMNSWLYAKLTEENAEFITKKLAKAEPAKRYETVINHLKEKYAKYGQAVPQIDKRKIPVVANSYADMVRHLNFWETVRKDPADLRLFTAVRSYFTIQFHKSAVVQKKADLAAWKKEDRDQMLLFNYTANPFVLPDSFYVPLDIDQQQKIGMAQMFDGQINEKLNKSSLSMVHRRLSSELQNECYIFSFYHLINFFLGAGAKEDDQNLAPRLGFAQEMMYKLQESALAIAMNPDIQRVIADRFSRLQQEQKHNIDLTFDPQKMNIFDQKAHFNTLISGLMLCFRDMGLATALVNHSRTPKEETNQRKVFDKETQYQWPMLQLTLDEMVGIILDEKSNTINNLRFWFQQLIFYVEQKKSEMLDLYKLFLTIKNKEFDSFEKLRTSLVRLINKYKTSQGITIDIPALNEKADNKTKDDIDEIKWEFVEKFNDEFTNLCKNNGTTIENIQNSLKKK